MNSGFNQFHDTQNLAERFMRVFETSFKQMSRKKHHNHLFKDLSVNKLLALNMLFQHPGTVQKRLAELLEITPAAISTLVRELESMGFVDRKLDKEDARLMRLYLSDEAHQVISETVAHRHAAIANLLGVLPLEEQNMIVSSLEKALQIYLNNEESNAHNTQT